MRYAELGACQGDLKNNTLAELPVPLLSFIAQKEIEISGIMLGVLVYGNLSLSFTLCSLAGVAILPTDVCLSVELL